MTINKNNLLIMSKIKLKMNLIKLKKAYFLDSKIMKAIKNDQVIHNY